MIIKEIKVNRNIPYFKIFKNLPRENYLSLIKNADLIIGNSSSGSIESSAFKLHVVNIDPREAPRERGNNVIDVTHNNANIINSIKVALSDEFIRKRQNVVNPYGDRMASERIMKYLENLIITKELLEKKFTYKV